MEPRDEPCDQKILAPGCTTLDITSRERTELKLQDCSNLANQTVAKESTNASKPKKIYIDLLFVEKTSIPNFKEKIAGIIILNF